MKPLCFVLMPFGKKPDPDGGGQIDFDVIYGEIIRPAIEAADMEPLRADEERDNGIIHKPMFERLLLCDFAIADLTTANPNVFYELGVRHARLEHTTIGIHCAGRHLPFDVEMIRALPYHLDKAGSPMQAAKDRDTLAERLKDARSPSADSPLYQLLENYPNIQRDKTDVFRAQVTYNAKIKSQLAAARSLQPKEARRASIHAIEDQLVPLADQEAGVFVDLLLSYRAVGAWDDMVRIVTQAASPVSRSTLVQEQLGFALNRAGQGEEAERVLKEVVRIRGSSSETNGLLGRVYKDRYTKALEAGEGFAAKGFLNEAIDQYKAGFESDWRDAYPGINAATLLYVADDRKDELERLIPVVIYSAERRCADGQGDYWDHATRCEAYLLGDRDDEAEKAAQVAVARMREPWEGTSTADNLDKILAIRKERGKPNGTLETIIRELRSRSERR